jgi:hypothetical protein
VEKEIFLKTRQRARKIIFNSCFPVWREAGEVPGVVHKLWDFLFGRLLMEATGQEQMRINVLPAAFTGRKLEIKSIKGGR